jgi:protein TonB
MSAVMSSDRNRAFHFAVAFSLALHGLLLFGLSMQRESARRAALPGPIIARLAQPPAPAPSPAPPPPQVQPLKPEPPVPAPKPLAKPKPVSKPAPVAKPAPKAVPRPAPPTAPVAQPQPVPPAPAPPVPSAPPAPPAPVAKATDPTPTQPAPAAESVDSGSLAQYRLQVISAARKYKRYPRVAMDNNWEGEVVVRMVIGANGMIAALSIKTSSGHEVLDRQALEMFKRAKPLVQIPPALRGKEFAVELRAIYNLKDQESG